MYMHISVIDYKMNIIISQKSYFKIQNKTTIKTNGMHKCILGCVLHLTLIACHPEMC